MHFLNSKFDIKLKHLHVEKRYLCIEINLDFTFLHVIYLTNVNIRFLGQAVFQCVKTDLLLFQLLLESSGSDLFEHCEEFVLTQTTQSSDDSGHNIVRPVSCSTSHQSNLTQS